MRVQASKLLKSARSLRSMNLDEASILSGYSVSSIERWEKGILEPKFSAVMDLLQDVYKLPYQEAIEYCTR